jgi:hypothetical protein
VVAFAGVGTAKTANALRLQEVEYQQLGQTVAITAYPNRSAYE